MVASVRHRCSHRPRSTWDLSEEAPKHYKLPRLEVVEQELHVAVELVRAREQGDKQFV
jgi:hypothetical protein